MNLMLASHGYPLHSPEAYRTFVGDGILMLIKRSPAASRRRTPSRSFM